MSRLSKRIIVIATLMLVALFSLSTVNLRSGSASGVRQPEANPRYLQPVAKLGGVACPPVTTIHGTLGSGSKDYPATSGQQTGRILNGLGNVTCGSSNPCSLNTATGSRTFDAYTFVNSGGATECVTVNFTMTGCPIGQSMQFSVRLGSFDPANPCANYLADGGAGFSGEVDNSFSFNVPAGQNFVVVVNENDPDSSVGCSYTLTISGLACQSSCPPTTAINGTLGSGSPDYPAAIGQQTGRILNGLGNITCGSSNPCSLNTPTGSRTFDAYTFVNPGLATACVTVSFTTGCTAGQSMQFSARLGSFDPANPCANYLGDAGAGFAGENDGSFSFNVPPGQSFVVVVNENDPAGATGCAYTLTVSGISCEVPPCPPATITGTIGKGSTDYPGTSGVQTGRVSQNGVDSTCAAPKTCPGITQPGLSFAFDSYEFVNDSSSAACASFTFPPACGVNNAIHPVLYLGSFDPANPCTNYLGDFGQSINVNGGGAFEVNVPANSTVVLVIHEVGSEPGCQGYSFSVTGLSCPQPCSVTCPSNITQPNDPNQCGAVVNFSTPTTTGDCGAVTCIPASGSFFPVGTTTVTCTEDSSSANCSFTVTINDTQPPTITCPANITTSNDANQCGAVVNYPAPTVSDNCPGVGAPLCSPASGSFFPVGTTTVTCTVADASPNSPDSSCTFTITVNDTQPPQITCPANVTAVTDQNVCPSPACTVVTYPNPVASDNCPGVVVVCNPPSGGCFPVGVTTVTCTATDASGNTATCSFTVSVFDTALQDDSDPSTILLWNSISGQYRFCCRGITFTGVGKSIRQGCVYTLEHNSPDRRVLGRVDKAVHAGSGSIQSPAGTLRCTITDRNTLNDLLTPPCQ